MKIDVKFEKTWSEETLKAWMDDPEDERWEDYSLYELEELNVLALLRQDEAFHDVDIATLHKVAEKAVWCTLDINMSYIIESMLCLSDARYELAAIQEESQEFIQQKEKEER